jgi:phospholipid/cholesterol/gamma-HCH transport system substrate-binding protein
MPRTRSLGWSELKIGVLTIAAIAIAAVLIFSLTGARGFFWQRYSLKTRFPNVAGLAAGSPVRVAGVEVGSVTAIDFAGEQLDVTFQVKTTLRDRITDGSVARLGSVSLLGESAVDITPSTSGTPIPEWGYVPQGRAAAALSDMTDQASQGIAELTGLIQDIRTGRGTVGKLMTDQELYTELHRFVATATGLTEGLKQGRGTLGRLLTDPQAANALEASLRNMEAMTRSLNAGEGSLGKLLKDETFSRSLTSATGNLDTLVGNLNRGQGTAGKLMTDPALFNRLNSVTERLDLVVNRLNEGEGTVGQLLKDKQLYENMNGAVGDVRALVADIRKDPRKFLNVRVSIF